MPWVIRGNKRQAMPGVVYSLTRLVVNPVSCTGQQKERHGGCSPPGLSFPHRRHNLGDADQRVALRSGMGWESSGSILGTGSGTWLQSPTRLRSRRNPVPSPRHGEGCRRCRKPRHCRWCVCALMCPSRRLHSEAFFALKQWITVPAASGRRCREKTSWKEERRITSEHCKDPRQLPACCLGQPNVSWACRGLVMAKRDNFLHYSGLGGSKRSRASMSVCYLL